jgi:hypothetical protein
MKIIIMVSLCLFLAGCTTPAPVTPPSPPTPPPPAPKAADISGTYTGSLEVKTCYPGQFASMVLTLSKDATTTSDDDYFGTLKTSETTVLIAAFNDGLQIQKFTIYSKPGQNGFVQFKVNRETNGNLIGTFSQDVNPGTCSDSLTSGEATGNVAFVP